MLNNFHVPGTVHICIGVCTYKRPEMLLRCLMSLRRMEIPDGINASFVVVDNEPKPANAELVASFQDNEFRYVHEPRRGISQARNAILDKAAELRADWVAMLDDDQRVTANWLRWLWYEQQREGADVVHGTVQKEMPEPLPKWAFPSARNERRKVGAAKAATNGVLFKAKLYDSAGMPLRFREEYALSGAEDRDFFSRAHRGGALIVKTPDAVAYETIPATKLTFGAQLRRAYSLQAADTRQDGEYMPRGYWLAHGLMGVGILAGSGLAHAIRAPFSAISGAERGRHRILRAGKKFARAAGVLTGLAGVRLAPYRNTHGH